MAAISTALGAGSISVMLDHPDQVSLLAELTSKGSGHPPLVFLKIDVAYHRAGVIPGTPIYDALLRAVLASEHSGHCVLHGLYAHAGQSYYTRSDWAALAYLSNEFSTLYRAAQDIRALDGGKYHPLVLSVGATPTATALQHPDLALPASATQPTPSAAPAAAPLELQDATSDIDASTRVASLSTLLADLRADPNLHLEVHAGVYPTLDLQQLATHARDAALLSSSDIGVSVLAEVASLYPGRGADGTDEALINAGSLALGREPCKEDAPGHYAGWGLVMPWGEPGLVAAGTPAPEGFPAVHGGWQVGRISQEHGVLTWAGGSEAAALRFGQRVRVWPNHSCIAGAGYDYYLVVDSRRKGKEDEVVDVWQRWNGW